MNLPVKDFVPAHNLCEWCCNVSTKRCARCSAAFYCSREHQLQHWPIHKKVCQKPQPSTSVAMNSRNISNETFLSFPPGTPNDSFISGIPPNASKGMFVNTVGTTTDSFVNMNLSNIAGESYASPGEWCQRTVPCSKNEGMNPAVLPTTICSSDGVTMTSQKNVTFPSEDDLFSSLNSEYLSEDTNFWNIINACAQDAVNYSTLFEGNTLNQIADQQNNASFVTDENTEGSIGPDPDSLFRKVALTSLCKNIVSDMNICGICVLDNFVGSNFGSLVFQEVKSMYMKGIFRKGELVNHKPHVSDESVRSDVTTWVNGTESYCKYIGSLMKKLDLIVSTCNTMPNNGIFSKYKLHRRTKAMIACYPGDGTHYKKHIDNPHQDGRCITCIYYLNKNWDSKKHGGLLRMFPSASETHIASIEPIFDRVIFFWSDKRNPHEVLPSFATRFAITVWYFDADERDQAVVASKNRALMKSRNQ